MIPATDTDRPEIEAFLRAAPHLAMFPLNNLARYGMRGGHEYALTLWIARKAGRITDVLAVTEGGMVLPRLPSGDFAQALAVLKDRRLTGMAGPAQEVRGLEAAGLAHLPRSLDADEPQFLLSLADLSVPDGPGEIRPLADAPPEIIKRWIYDYDLNTLNADPDGLVEAAAQTYDRYLADGSHVVLMDGATPLAMTGFNAALPDIVQVGGVYTPPELRGRGHARRACALHLQQAARAEVAQATLFSASEMAARAYRAIGFQHVGEWTLILFDGDPA